MSSPSASAPVRRIGSVDRPPWFVTTMTVGATSILVGVIWDISWHSTIGRDSFWTPAHMAIYLGGVLAGLTGGWLALRTTFFGSSDDRAAAVKFWGFRAPLGAWLAIWGAIAMIASAPFDDWWHNAYGLDVEILSPPHTVLALGMLAVTLGALLLALALQNRSGDASRVGFNLVFAYCSGLLIALAAILTTDYRWTNLQHSGLFFQVSAVLYPIFLVAAARASRLKWAATTIAGIYMLLNLIMLWILPLFPAEPLLAPIFNPVNHMVTDVWPVLLIVPAIAIDLIMQRWDRNDWLLTPVLAFVFVVVFLAVQWFFSIFLLSSWAENRFFGSGRQWSYEASPGDWMHEFWRQESDPVTLISLAIALGLAAVSMRLGLWWGDWMTRLAR